MTLALMMAFMRRYWREGLIVLAGVWILAGFYTGHRDEVQESNKPIQAQQAERAEGWKEITRPCVQVVEKVIQPKEAKRIERDFGVRLDQKTRLPDQIPLTAEIADNPKVLGLFDVPSLKYGGEALALLNPDGHTALTFKPAAPPFISFRPIWGLGAVVDPFNWRESWKGYGLVEPAHFRENWHVRGTAGIEGRDGKTGAFLFLGLEYRSR